MDRAMHVLMVPDSTTDREWRRGLWLSRQRIRVRGEADEVARAETLFRQGEMVAMAIATAGAASAEEGELLHKAARAGHPILLSRVTGPTPASERRTAPRS